jgi:hypothetical protein
VNNEMKTMWKETVGAQFEVLSQHFSGRTEKNHEKRQSDKSFSGLRFKSRTA